MATIIGAGLAVCYLWARTRTASYVDWLIRICAAGVILWLGLASKIEPRLLATATLTFLAFYLSALIFNKRSDSAPRGRPH